MKVSKKPISTKNIANVKSSDGSASGIKTYFKATQKSFSIDKTVPEAKPNDDAKQFYVDILKKKLRRVPIEGDIMAQVEAVDSMYDEETSSNIETNQVHEEVSPVESGGHAASNDQCNGCVEKSIEIAEWQNKYNAEVAQRKEFSKLYVNSTVSFSELYAKYNNLLKTTAALPEIVDDPASSKSSDDIFTSNELKYLQCIPLEKDQDCTFIHTSLRFVYKADLSVLATKTLKGTSERIEITSDGQQIHHPAKNPMTPPKVRRIQTLFIERIAKCGINSTDYKDRMKEAYVNKFFAAGIRNLSRSKKAK